MNIQIGTFKVVTHFEIHVISNKIAVSVVSLIKEIRPAVSSSLICPENKLSKMCPCDWHLNCKLIIFICLPTEEL